MVRRSFPLLVVAMLTASLAQIHPSAAATGTGEVIPRGLARALGMPRALPVREATTARPVAIDRPLFPPDAVLAAKVAARASGMGFDYGVPAIGGPRISSSFGFDANVDATPTTSPADPSGALGPNWYVTATNVKVGVYDRSGVLQAGFPVRLRSIGGVLPPGTFDFDPKVVYDPYDDEFVLIFLAVNDTHSWIVIVAIPESTADDTGTWCTTRLGGDQRAGDGKQLADYPGLGFTSDRVTVTTNQFPFRGPGYDYAQILSFPKSRLYDCTATLKVLVFADKQTRNPDGSPGFTIQPARTTGGTSPTTQFLVEFLPSTAISGRQLILWRLREGAGFLTLAKASLVVGKAVVPPFGTQGNGGTGNPDTWWDTGDLRLTDAFFDADVGLLYTAHAVQYNFGPSAFVESAVRWYEIDVAFPLAASALTRRGVVGQDLRDAAWPSVATDAGGNLFVNYSQASAPAGEFLSIYAAVIPPGSVNASPILLKAGQARYEHAAGDIERWGDFSSIARDPLDASMLAAVNAYAVDDGSAPTFLWQQHVDAVTTP